MIKSSFAKKMFVEILQLAIWVNQGAPLNFPCDNSKPSFNGAKSHQLCKYFFCVHPSKAK